MSKRIAPFDMQIAVGARLMVTQLGVADSSRLANDT